MMTDAPRPDEDGHCTRCGLLWEQDEIDGLLAHECPPGFLTPIRARGEMRTERELIWEWLKKTFPGCKFDVDLRTVLPGRDPEITITRPAL